MNFDELKLAPAILKAVREEGYDTPTPIQAQAIPAVLAGGDLLAGAQTGTGKTAAFMLPVLHRLAMSPSAKNRFGGTGVRVLVMTPTRELAAQVEESAKTYGKYLQLTTAVVFGGVGMNPQINALRKGVDILVATPGRLLDLQGQGKLDLSTVQTLVLDEADRMLDMGFIHDIKKVLALLPKQKQTLLFSATFSDEIRELTKGLLHNPTSIQVTPSNSTVQRITQTAHLVGRGKKKALLTHIIQQHNWSQVLVFTRTKFGANNVAEHLTKNGIEAMALHGNKSQGARTQALAGFKSGSIRALVATDIAARGIDIEDLPHVVNYEIPNVSEDYVHRIGRTGRAGKEGQAVSLVCLDEEGFMQDIGRFTKQQFTLSTVDGFAPEPGEKAEPIAMGRQTIWGGAGRPPSRDVMQAAAKAARTEMLQRVRENKASSGGGRSGGGRNSAAPAGARHNGAAHTAKAPHGQSPHRNEAGRNNAGDAPRTALLEARRTALLAGATGLVGRELLALLLADTDYAAVHCVGRRRPAQAHARLVHHQVDTLTPAALSALALPAITDVYIALGTTIKVAGSQEAFRAIDFDAVVAVVRAGLESGAINLGVVSAMGASARSGVFYNRVKGEMEDAVRASGYACTVIAQPALIMGDRASLGQAGRMGEGLAIKAMRWLAPITPAGLRAIDALKIARALHTQVKAGRPGVQMLSSGAMQRY